MRVLRTVTIENSAATKNPFANTRARTPAGRHTISAMPQMLRLSIAEEVRVDEVVDDRLVRGLDRFELNAHADAAIAPRDVSLGVDVALGAGHAEADLDLRARLERARRANGDAAVAQIERQRRRDRVAEPVLERHAERHARAPGPV